MLKNAINLMFLVDKVENEQKQLLEKKLCNGSYLG